MSIARIQCPDIVGRGHIEDIVHPKDGALDGRAVRIQLSGSFAPNDRSNSGATATAGNWRRIHSGEPGQRKILDGRSSGLRQRAIAPARVVAGGGWPCIDRRLQKGCRIETALTLLTLDSQQRGSSGQRSNKNELVDSDFDAPRHIATTSSPF